MRCLSLSVLFILSLTLSPVKALELPSVSSPLYNLENYTPLSYSSISQARVYYSDNGDTVYKDANYNSSTGIYHTYTEYIGFPLDSVMYRFRTNTTDNLVLSPEYVYCITFHGQEFSQMVAFEALTSEIGNTTSNYTNFDFFMIADNTYQLFFIPESEITAYYLKIYFNCYSETVFLENINYPNRGYTLYQLELTADILNEIENSNRLISIENNIEEINNFLSEDTDDTIIDDFTNEVDELQQQLEDSLGFIYQSIMYVYDIYNALLYPDDVGYITFPEFKFREYTIIEETDVQLIPDGMEIIQDVSRTITSIVFVSLLVNLGITKFKAYVGGRI